MTPCCKAMLSTSLLDFVVITCSRLVFLGAGNKYTLKNWYNLYDDTTANPRNTVWMKNIAKRNTSTRDDTHKSIRKFCDNSNAYEIIIIAALLCLEFQISVFCRNTNESRVFLSQFNGNEFGNWKFEQKKMRTLNEAHCISAWLTLDYLRINIRIYSLSGGSSAHTNQSKLTLFKL